MLIVPRIEPEIINSNIIKIDPSVEVYDATKTYKKDDEVQYEGTIYKSLKDGSLGETPTSKVASWSNKGRTNYYRLFDAFMNSSTTNSEKIEYEFKISDVDTVAFFALEANSVSIELKNDDGEIIYEKTHHLLDRNVSNWYDWTYATSEAKQSTVFTNICMVYSGTLKVTIENGSDEANCGHLVYGRSRDIGLTLAEPKPISSIRNMISKEKGEDGVVRTTNSMTYKRVVANVLLQSESVDWIQEELERFTVTPCLYIADARADGFRSLMVYGFYKDFDLPIGLSRTQYQLEIEGVI